MGYGYVKAISDKNRVLFPSVISPAAENPVEAVMGFGGFSKTGHFIEIRGASSLKRNKLYVGELAMRSGRAVQMTLARERFSKDASLTLAMTGAYLAGAEGRIALGFGVPLAYYRHQRFEVQKALQDMSAYIGVDGGPERPVSFSQVYVFPQGVGALFGSVGNLPSEGLVGLVDIGYHTTDFLLVELKQGSVEPLPGFMSSVEVGVHTAQKLFSDAFQRETGKPLALIDAQAFWPRKEITFGGQKINIEGMTLFARMATGQAIAETVMAAWSEKTDYLDNIFLAGGGAMEFGGIFQKHVGKAEIVADPQHANAAGFYRMLERALVAGKKDSATQS